MRRLAPALVLAFAACAGLRDGYYVKGPLKYRVVEPPAPWRQVGFSDNDLAWDNGGSVISINATCEGHGDPSLEVLTRHLLFGFTEATLVERKTEPLDGREGLWSHYQAKLDGVPVELELLVLKKNGCVHDFSRVAPAGDFERDRAPFTALVQGFTAERSP